MNKHDADALRLSLSQDRGEDRSPDPDPDLPLADPPPTQDWVLGLRFAECSICAARDHWRQAGDPCPLAPDGADQVEPETAFARLRAELAAFVAHWRARGFGARPTMNDWRAEAFEYSRDPKARQTRRK
jgi:hypothetical protein